MSEPPRLLEESTSPVERALLEAGTSYRSSASVHAKTLAAVGIVGTAAVTEVAGASLSNLAWPKWLTALSVVGATAAVPVVYYTLQDPEPVAQVRPAPRRQPVAPNFIEPVTPDEPKPIVEVKPAPVARSETRAARDVSLMEETQAVDAARTALLRGEVRSALSALDTYARKYPRGRLALEAEALRIDALDKSGQRESAKRRAETFLRNNPKSVLAPRVRRILGN